MKKSIKISPIIFAFLLFANISCEDFLKEENKTGVTEDIVYSTKTGLDGLVATSYSYLRGWYGKQGGLEYSEEGVDTWLTGGDNLTPPIANYENMNAAASSSEYGNCMFDEYWELMYTAVNTCNTGIKYVALANPNVLSEADKNTYIGELKALRAFYYWHMVETWGPVQINKEPTTAASSTAVRNSVEEVYAFMLEDINEAITLLANKTDKTGRINLWAAKALKARFLLYKASKFDDNQAYIDAAAMAEEVISGSGLSFFDQYAKCWDADHQVGSSNQEVIWYIDYSTTLQNNVMPWRLKVNGSGEQINWSSGILRDGSNSTGGNASHLFFAGIWNKINGFSVSGQPMYNLTEILVRTATEESKIITYKGKKYDLGTSYQAYSRGYREILPSGYLLDLFNENTDQRYKASFRDTWLIAPSLQTAFASNVPRPAGFVNMRDTAIYMTKNTATAAQIARSKKRYCLYSRTAIAGDSLVYPLYTDAAGTEPTIGLSETEWNKGNQMYINLKKFDDLTGSVNRILGDRDYFVIRLSEMYLIAAEGYMMSGNSSKAIGKLNALRNARAIPGQTNVLTGAEEAQVAAQDISVILDERGRELCGEQQRWFDLERTGTLVERVRKYNKYAGRFIQPYHVVRPIPQNQLDAITNQTGGPSPNGFWQNEGY